MSFSEFVGALDANPRRTVVRSELLASTDAATLATALDALPGREAYTTADKALVQELLKFKGEHADEAALVAAFPPGAQQDDAWAFVEDTDTVWVIDADTSTWKDTQGTTAPATVDTALNVASTNALSNQVITGAMNARLQAVHTPIPGNGASVTFPVDHGFGVTNARLDSVHLVRINVDTTRERVGITIKEVSATQVVVGPFAVAPPNATTYEVVFIGVIPA